MKRDNAPFPCFLTLHQVTWFCLCWSESCSGGWWQTPKRPIIYIWGSKAGRTYRYDCWVLVLMSSLCSVNCLHNLRMLCLLPFRHFGASVAFLISSPKHSPHLLFPLTYPIRCVLFLIMFNEFSQAPVNSKHVVEAAQGSLTTAGGVHQFSMRSHCPACRRSFAAPKLIWLK